MSREVIIRLIQEERDEEIQTIRSRMDEESGRIREDARLRAEEKREEIRRATERKIEAERRAILLRAEYESMAAARRARWEGIAEVFRRAEVELQAIASSPAYPRILRYLIIEGMAVIGERAITILCRSDDRKAAEEAIKDLKGVTVTPLSGDDRMIGIGGVILLADDGKIRCDQTFQTRLEDMRNHLTQEVARILYGGDHAG